ncbi:MAG TPA: hypothetical protein VGO50_19835 [Pyrinomonadaceae bacterium]|jgi:DNA-directed RNA polymerase specialized sigma24 family protein|nr:hypothetical protein [Pyrinomonadaceae bacterium]
MKIVVDSANDIPERFSEEIAEAAASLERMALGFVSKYPNPVDLQKDAMSMAVINVIKHIKSHPLEPIGNLRGYLYTAFKRSVLDIFRNEKPGLTSSLDEEGESGSRGAERKLAVGSFEAEIIAKIDRENMIRELMKDEWTLLEKQLVIKKLFFTDSNDVLAIEFARLSGKDPRNEEAIKEAKAFLNALSAKLRYRIKRYERRLSQKTSARSPDK